MFNNYNYKTTNNIKNNNINNKKNLFNSIFLRYKNDFTLCIKKLKIKNKNYDYVSN